VPHRKVGRQPGVIAQGADEDVERPARLPIGQLGLGEAPEAAAQEFGTRKARMLGQILEQVAIGPVEVDLDGLANAAGAMMILH